MRYKEHVIQHDDTIQYIAQKYYGNVNYWEKIVEHNDLEYPYIVLEPERKLMNPEHWKTIGDRIIIPIEQNLFDNEDNKGQLDEDLILQLALGTDIKMSNETQGSILGELTADEHGDIALSKGVDNIKQATVNRLLTPRGSLLLHPNYGSTITQFLGQRGTQETLNKIDNEIQATIKKDSRIQGVTLEHSEIAEDGYRGEFTVTLYATDQYFELVVAGDAEGDLTIT